MDYKWISVTNIVGINIWIYITSCITGGYFTIILLKHLKHLFVWMLLKIFVFFHLQMFKNNSLPY